MWSGIWSVATTRIGFWTWIWSTRHWTRAGIGLLISLLEKSNWFHLTGLIALVLLLWKWMGLALRKNHLLRCWDWLSLPNWIGALTLSLSLKVPPTKLEPWFVLWSFFSWNCSAYLYISTIHPCMEYCSHVRAGAPNCYLELLDKLQKRIYRTVSSSFATSFKPLAHCRNVASLSLL